MNGTTSVATFASPPLDPASVAIPAKAIGRHRFRDLFSTTAALAVSLVDGLVLRARLAARLIVTVLEPRPMAS